MPDITFVALHKRSDATNTAGNAAVSPSSTDIEYGEIAMNYASGVETLYIKNSANSIVGITFEAGDKIDDHVSDTDNPHEVTKAQIGLGNVDNTSDANKPVTDLIQKQLDTLFNVSDLYNSYTDDGTDLTTKAWTAAMGNVFKSSLDTYISGDTSAIEARIAWCETNV